MNTKLDSTQMNKFAGSFFVLNQDQEDVHYSLIDDFLITDHRKQLKEYFISKIREAKESIKLCSFILTDEEVVWELEKAITQRNIPVFVLTQLDESKFTTTYLSDEEVAEIQKTSGNIHLGLIKGLYETGGHIRAAENLHAKFMIIDRKEVLITSANITTPSLNQNTELGFVCRNKPDVEEYDRLFDLIYQHGAQYEKFISSGKNTQFIVKSDSQIKNEWFPDSNESALKFTFDSIEQSIYTEIIRIIEESNDEVLLATYSIVHLEALPELIQAIRAALDRNVRIKIFCRAMNYRPDHLKNTGILYEMGCQIYGDVLNHAKGILNENEGFIFTANIDGAHGLKDGFEVGYNLNENECVKLRAFFEYKLSIAPFEFKNNPLKPDLFDSYEHYYEEKNINNPFERGHYILNMVEDIDLERALISNPIFIHTNKYGKPLHLEVGMCLIPIKSFEDNKFEIDSQKRLDNKRNSIKYILPFHNLQIINE